MERILEWLKRIGNKSLEFWNKYTAKQKTVIISVVLAIFFALVLLVYFLSRPVYVQFLTLDDTKVASEMVTALDEASIPNEVQVSNDKTTISVEQSRFTDATLLIGSDQNFSSDMTWDQAVTNGMDTTKLERQTKLRLALQNSIAQGLKKFDGVNNATVYIDAPEDDGTIYGADNSETSVSVSLNLSSGATIDSSVGKNLARFVANAAGCKTTDKIIIMDTNRNLIFSGENDGTLGGAVSDTAEFKSKLANTISEDVKNVLLKTGYDNVQLGTSGIKFNMDKVKQLKEEYTIPTGRDEGYVTSDYTYKSVGASGSGGTPGTDSNGDDTTYMVQDSGTSNSETTLDKNERALNKLTEERELEIGAVDTANSSLSVVMTKYKIVHEEALQSSGALNNTTFDAYAEANNALTPITVPQNIYTLVSNNTGIPVNKISIIANEQPIFQSAESSSIDVTNYLMIVLAVLIAALLVFVIIKGTSPVKVTELEPELSVEDLLASTAEETALEEIEMDQKSELRMLVDKFVDDNPEAVASLLRNWLNEDWG